MYAAGCPRAKILYTLDVKPLKRSGQDPLDTVVVNTEISYGMINLKGLPIGDYEITVKQKGDENDAPGFMISVYSKKAKLVFMDNYFSLSGSLRRAEMKRDKLVSHSTAEDGKVLINSFNDKKIHKITVEVVKSKNVTRDYQITIQVQTKGGFPFKTESNTDWKNGLVYGNATLTEADSTEQFYVMKVNCPAKEMRCIYVIPRAKKLIQVLVGNDVAS